MDGDLRVDEGGEGGSCHCNGSDTETGQTGYSARLDSGHLITPGLMCLGLIIISHYSF